MTLNYQCPHCKKASKCSVYELDRVELIRKYGEAFMQTCTLCYKPSKVEARHIRANTAEWLEVQASIVQLVLLVLGIVLWWGVSRYNIVTVWGYVSLIFTFVLVPQMIISLLRKSDMDKVSYFNSYLP